MYADVTGMRAYCPTTNVVRPYANFLLLDEVNSSLCGSSTHRGLLNRPLLLEDISFLSWNEVNISSEFTKLITNKKVFSYKEYNIEDE